MWKNVVVQEAAGNKAHEHEQFRLVSFNRFKYPRALVHMILTS